MKILTENDVRWKGTDHYCQSKFKRDFNGDPFGFFWQKKYAPKKSIGAVVDLCKRLGAKSCEDFYNKYFENGNNTFGDTSINPINRGRTYDEIEEMAINWRKDCNLESMPLVDFFDAIILHAIVETAIGAEKEDESIEFMKYRGYDVEHSNDKEDSEFGIDFKVSRNGKLLFFVQVKPLSFVTGTRPHTINDRINVFDKHRKGSIEFPGIPYYYMVYDKDEWLENHKRKSLLFKYEDLVHDDGKGTPVQTSYMFRKHKKDVLVSHNI